MKINFSLLIVSVCLTTNLLAQSEDYEKNSLGLGFGLDFGGIGTSFTTYPTQKLGLFAGLGYALADIGINGGVKYRFVSDQSYTRIAPYLIAMYGYNTAVVVSNYTAYNKMFYGPSLGVGVDFLKSPDKKGYWSLAIILPIRGSDVDDYLNDLRTTKNVVISSPSPVAFSVGYRFKL